jgi:hypothetical protein
VSRVGEKAISIEVLAKGISNDLAAIRVKAFEGLLHVVVLVGGVVVVFQSSRKLKACEKRSSFSASGSLFLVAWVNYVAHLAKVIRRRVSADVLPGNAGVMKP